MKKSQTAAIRFAHDHNIKRQIVMLTDPVYTNSSEQNKRNFEMAELFDFQLKGRLVTPLHYVVRKSNYEAFMFMVQRQLCDYLYRSIDQ